MFGHNTTHQNVMSAATRDWLKHADSWEHQLEEPKEPCKKYERISKENSDNCLAMPGHTYPGRIYCHNPEPEREEECDNCHLNYKNKPKTDTKQGE